MVLQAVISTLLGGYLGVVCGDYSVATQLLGLLGGC